MIRKIQLIKLAALLLSSGASMAQQKNVLFIAVDDLRPELGCYGHPMIQSPNMDKLAESGIRFTRSYCNVPVCGASRASILSGVRPGVNRFLNYNTYLDKDLPGAVSLPMHFRKNGYETISLGKMFHHADDGKGSWDINWRPEIATGRTFVDYQTKENIDLINGGKSFGYPYEKADVSDDSYFDGQIAARAIDELTTCSKSGKPFFLAVGFLKPHLPFNAPSKYWDLYPDESIKLPAWMKKPIDAPDLAMHNFGELRAYYGVPAEGPVSEELAKKLTHGYYACVSYTDAQIGRVLDKLKELGLDKNTIVVLWGDHGWQLGEHGLWCKHCNFEKVLHTPLIMRAPGYKSEVVSDQLVEYVDVYPTLCDLAGLSKPSQLEGNSMVPLLNGEPVIWKDAVFSRWIKGETIVTKSHTYTEWFNDGKSIGRMLYDLNKDSEETINVSEKTENKDLIDQLRNRLLNNIKDRETIIINQKKR